MIPSSRLKTILNICLKQDDYISMDKLSSLLQISKRTVFRELVGINQVLDAYHLVMENKVSQGVRLVGSDDNKQKLLNELQSNNSVYLQKDERRQWLLFELLRTSEVQKLYYYASLFAVSQSTIHHDLDEMEAYLKSFSIRLERTPGLGIKVIADEMNVRKALTMITKNLLHAKSVEQVDRYDTESLLEQIFMGNEHGIMYLLERPILTKILAVFKQYRHELMLDQYAQSSYIGLIIHLTIAIDRIVKQEALKQDVSIMHLIQDDPCYMQAKQMAHYLEDSFEIKIVDSEIAYIAMHIKGAKWSHQDHHGMIVKDDRYQLVEAMIRCFDESQALLQDSELIHGLLAHIYPTLIRLQYQLPIYNPLLNQIKETYPIVYMQAQNSAMCIQKQFGYKVSEDEVAYLAMHFGAAQERLLKHTKNKIHIGVVCSSGIGVSALLVARIKKLVHADIKLECLGMDDLSNKSDYDFLISTYYFESNIPCIIVNPLLSEEDLTRIHYMIQLAHKQTTSKQILHVEHQYMEVIIEVLNSIQLLMCENRVSKSELIEWVSQMIGYDQLSKEAIAVTLKQREKLNTTFYPAFHFALLHGRTQGVTTCVCNVVRCSDTFLHTDLVGIEFVVVLLIPDNHSRDAQNVMSQISSNLLEETVFDAFSKGNQEVIYTCVENIMKDYVFKEMQKGTV